MTGIQYHLTAVLAGCVLDALIGDPHSLPHPVCAIGSLIQRLERFFRGLFGKGERAREAGGDVYGSLGPGSDGSGCGSGSDSGLLNPSIFRRGSRERDVWTDDGLEISPNGEHGSLPASCGG